MNSIPTRQKLTIAACVLALGLVALFFVPLSGPVLTAIGTGLSLLAVGLVAEFHQDGDTYDYTPGSAVTAGTPTKLADGRVGIPANDIAANRKGALRIKGIFKIAAASATTWSDGDEIWYDASAAQAVKKSLTGLDGSADFRLGIAVGAKASGALYGYVDLNAERNLDPIVYEFDCETGVDTTEHILIPAAMNPNGLLFLGAYGIVSEVFGGASQDQGIVTVEDTDNNALCTLTPSDGGADAANDVVVGTSDLYSASTGDAAKVVAAGKGIRGQVTQVTAGAGAAGKMKVYVRVIPLV